MDLQKVYIVIMAFSFVRCDFATFVNDDSQCAEGYYGHNCRHHCHCQNITNCQAGKECHGPCVDGWAGPTCQAQNIAFARPTAVEPLPDGSSSRSAVDGDGSTCTSSDPDHRGWLKVDLQKTSDVYYLSLLTEQESPRGWLIYVTDLDDYRDLYWTFPCATVRSDSRHVYMACDSPTRGRYLVLVNPRGSVSVCEIMTLVCADFSFGPQCEMTCNCADASEVCHPLTGHCKTGCRFGFSGRNCQAHCNMTYGSNCATRCGYCSHNASCNAVTGMCPNSCSPGWTGSHCNITCRSGRYGKECLHICGQCLDNAPCAADTGYCPGQCQPGLTGPRCDTECKNGRYGSSCQFQCGHCVSGTNCDIRSGFCLQGCEAGWEGLFCMQECLPHNYGHNCQHSCSRCLTSCDRFTGICDDRGCISGYRGPTCHQVCMEGFYGYGCNRTCGACLHGSCDNVIGDCLQLLCEDGWQGRACNQACHNKFYGTNCSQSCGACKGGLACDHVTGVCPGECEEGYEGNNCQTMTLVRVSTSKASVALIATLMTIGSLVVIMVCICLVLKWRRDKYVFHLTFVRSPLTTQVSRASQ